MFPWYEWSMLVLDARLQYSRYRRRGRRPTRCAGHWRIRRLWLVHARHAGALASIGRKHGHHLIVSWSFAKFHCLEDIVVIVELKRCAAIRSMRHFSSILLIHLSSFVREKWGSVTKVEVKTGSLPLGEWHASHSTKNPLMDIKIIEEIKGKMKPKRITSFWRFFMINPEQFVAKRSMPKQLENHPVQIGKIVKISAMSLYWSSCSVLGHVEHSKN